MLYYWPLPHLVSINPRYYHKQNVHMSLEATGTGINVNNRVVRPTPRGWYPCVSQFV